MLVYLVSKDIEKDGEESHETKGPVWANPSVISEDHCDVMFSLWLVIHGKRRLKMVVRKELLIRKHPIATHKVKGWCHAHGVKDLVRYFVVIHRWQLVEVVHHVFLDTIEDENCRSGNWEQQRDAKAEHKCDENN